MADCRTVDLVSTPYPYFVPYRRCVDPDPAAVEPRLVDNSHVHNAPRQFLQSLDFLPSHSHILRPSHRGAGYHRRNKASLFFPLFVPQYKAGLRFYCKSTNISLGYYTDVAVPCIFIISGTSRKIQSTVAVVMGCSRRIARRRTGDGPCDCGRVSVMSVG